MRTLRFFQILALTTLLFAIKANAQEAITISGTKFTYPLIEKWISEYQKENPREQVKIVATQADQKQADISILAKPVDVTNPDSLKVIVVGRYALLPVAGKSNTVFANIKKRGLNKKEIQNIFFEKDAYDDEDGDTKKKEKENITVYARDNKVCSAVSFAKYFDRNANQIKGKKISGDDKYLLSSVKKDTLGVTYNNLGYLYNTENHKLQDGLKILPLDIGKEQNEVLQNGTLEAVVNLLETNKYETIPTAEVNFVYASQNKSAEVRKFVAWVLENGQKFNHDLGFLNLKKDVLLSQTQKLAVNYLAKDNK